MTAINPNSPVLVTGATGFVAGWLIQKLLTEGHTVHACVRDPANTEKIAPLQQLANQAKGDIRFFKADLLSEGAYKEAMCGCELVFHTASPFTLDVPDPQRDLIDPALTGTRNVLSSVNDVDTVKRVVLTSSIAAIYDSMKDVDDTPERKFTEAVWNTRSTLEGGAYSLSKLLAEQAAWEIVSSQTRWDLVTINPSLVLGPAIGSSSTSESFTTLTQMGDGTMASGVPALAIAAVDVRDVADAHYEAGFQPQAEGRYIISAQDTDLFSIAQILRKTYGKRYPIPEKKVPKWLLWLLAPLVTKGKMTRRMVSRNVGITAHFDNGKSIRELGINYRPLETSLNDMFDYMINNNYFSNGSEPASNK